MQVGIAGLGAGAVQVIRAMAHAPYMQLMAALEVGLAIRQSAHEHREILLSHQRDATSPPDSVDTDGVLAHHGGDL
jgi:hypothetical protein